MELLLLIGIGVFFGILALSAVVQQNAQPPRVVYIRAEQLDALQQAKSDNGLGLVFFCLVIVLVLCFG